MDGGDESSCDDIDAEDKKPCDLKIQSAMCIPRSRLRLCFDDELLVPVADACSG